MCRPSVAPAVSSSPSCKKSHSSGSSNTTLSSALLYGGALLVALVVVGGPIVLSELIGGWTTKYTSLVKFRVSHIQDMTDTVVVVTGANTGIGYHTALELARANATVIVAARDPRKGQAAVSKIQTEIAAPRDSLDERVRFLPLDLSSLGSVRDFASKFRELGLPLHLLVLNAGVMKSPGSQFVGRNFTYGFELTREGFEMHIGVNHVAHFYLVELLQDVLVGSAPSRVVVISSMAEEGAYQPDGIRFSTWKPLSSSSDEGPPADYEDGIAYGQSKLANVLFARELAFRLNGTGVTSYSCHPGVILTELGRYMEKAMNAEFDSQKNWLVRLLANLAGQFFALSNFKAEDGALTQLHLSTADASSLVNGAFYHPIGRAVGSGRHSQGSNDTLRQLTWVETERVIREAGF